MKKKGKKRKQKRTGAISAPDRAIAAALDHHRSGRLDEAERGYRRILRTEPERVDALHLLGLVRHGQDDAEEALSLLERVITLQPDNTKAMNDLGNVLHGVGKLSEAARWFRKLVERTPDDAVGFNNLGIVLKDQGAFDEALGAYQCSLELDPQRPGTLCNLGHVLSRLERWDEAAVAYREAIAVDRTCHDAYQKLVAVLRSAGKPNECREALEQWLEAEPQNPVANHMIGAYTEKGTPTRASDDYVRQVFDRFAENFSGHLQELDYRGPHLIAEAVVDALGPARPSLDVADAGCGTGLCGPHLRPYARSLVGIDLSPAMLGRARRLDVYDELVEAELTSYLEQHVGAFDLIVAADTLNYFGDLDSVLGAAASALRTGGRIVFTLEHGETVGSDPGYRLDSTGRYSHSEIYVRKRLEAAGLMIAAFVIAVLRVEASQPVAAMVITGYRTR